MPTPTVVFFFEVTYNSGRNEESEDGTVVAVLGENLRTRARAAIKREFLGKPNLKIFLGKDAMEPGEDHSLSSLSPRERQELEEQGAVVDESGT